MDEDFNRAMSVPGFALRVGISICTGILWLCFLIIWLFFFASNFTIYQNLAIFLVSILLVGAVLGPSWAVWGMKYEHEFECKEHKKPKRKPKRKKSK